MVTATTLDKTMARKRAPKGEVKPDTTLIRVTVEFAEALRIATSFERTSVGEFATKHLLPVVRKHYRDAVMREAKRMEGSSK
jgi:hypothetical protein